MSEATERLARLAERPDDQIDLAEAALVIALEEYPALDLPACRRRLDELGAGAGAAVAGARGAEAIGRLAGYLGHDQGFQGNQEEYYDPRNSFLNEVLDRRRGIPITLAIVYLEVGRRAGLSLQGVGFPGHFLVRSDEGIILDPFSGRILGPDDCRELLTAATGSDASFGPELLRAATPREILVRMLRNLKQIYLRQQDTLRALGAVHRILVLIPEQPDELRDRGALYLKLECYAAALADFERYLELVPKGGVAARIRATLPELQRQATRLQ